jgi:hypothetical protein
MGDRFLLAGAIAGLVACHRDSAPTGPTVDVRGPDGLVVAVPASLRVEPTADGFHARLGAEDVSVTVHTEATHPTEIFPASHLAGGQPFPYRLDRSSGASGRTLTLSAWAPRADGYVLLSETGSGESSAATDGWLLWSVAAGVRSPSGG